MSGRNSSPREWKNNLLLLAVSFLLVAASGEVVSRLLLGAPLPWRYPQVRYRSDQNLVFSMVPNQRAFTADKPLTISAHGLRGREIDYQRRPGVLRILFLGDSIVFGMGVREEEVVTARVKTLLASRGIKAEVINTAVPSYNTEQEVDFLRLEGIRYEPDWVILGMCWNDINDKSEVTVNSDGFLVSPGETARGPSRKYLVPQQAYDLRNLLKRSRLVFATTQGVRAVHELLDPDPHTLFRADVLKGKETPRIAEGWRHVGEALHDLREISEAHQFHLLVVTFPIPIALEESFPRSLYPARVLNIAKEEGIAALDLEPPFRSVFHGHDSLFVPYDGDHPNAVGHDLAAREIVKFLLSDPSKISPRSTSAE